MKRKILISIVVVALNLIFVSCSGMPEDNKEYIDLCDYKDISVSSEYLEISDKDIQSIIYMDFSSKENYEITGKKIIEKEDIVLLSLDSSNEMYCCSKYYYEVGYGEISEDLDNLLIGKATFDSFDASIEFEGEKVCCSVVVEGVYVLKDTTNEKNILEFYKCDTLEDAYAYIKQRAQNEIIFNYMWETVKENSDYIEIPSFVEEKISDEILQLNNLASISGMTLNEYLDESGMTLDDIKQNVYSYYHELMIAEAILLKENIVINDEMKVKYRNKLAEDNDLSVEKTEEYFSDEDLYYYAVMQELEKVLVTYINIEY